MTLSINMSFALLDFDAGDISIVFNYLKFCVDKKMKENIKFSK